jgi:hypothetical protein
MRLTKKVKLKKTTSVRLKKCLKNGMGKQENTAIDNINLPK